MEATIDFVFSDRCEELRSKLLSFMDEHVYPAEEPHFAELERGSTQRC